MKATGTFSGYNYHYMKFHSDTKEHYHRMTEYLYSLTGSYLPINQESYILDVGCGMGFFLKMLKDCGYDNSIGVDSDEQQIYICRKNGFQVEHTNDTINYLTSKECQFDLIVAIDVIEHFHTNEQIQLCQAMHTALKPNGRLIIQVPNANSSLAERWRYIDYTHQNSFTEHSIDYLLYTSGFRDISVRSSDTEYNLPKPSGISDVLLNKNKYYKRLYNYILFKLFRTFRRLQLQAELGIDSAKNIPISLNLLCVCNKQA